MSISDLVSAEFKEGDFNEDIAYGQRLLVGLGYSVGRQDGYFDDSTARAVYAFRVDAKAEANNVMDRKFFSALKAKVEEYRNDRANDAQLQMAIGYINHVISKMKTPTYVDCWSFV